MKTHDWIKAKITEAGATLTGEIEDFHVTSTAAVLRANTDRGWLYFKGTIPVFKHEAAVTATLAAWFPDYLPQVVAVDAERGWLLMEDAGISLRELAKQTGQPPVLDTMLRNFATLQQQAAPRVEELLAAGLPDWRLDKLPGLFQSLLADTDYLMIGHKDGMTAEHYARLCAFAPEVEALCQQLATYNLPQTLHHDDFHTGNTTLKDGHYRFIDWGESYLCHPLCSLLIVLRYAKFVNKVDEAALAHIQQTYLECWTDYEPMPRLEAAFRLAAHLTGLTRALSWYIITKGVAPHEQAEYMDRTPYWLLNFLGNSPLELDLQV